MYWCYVDSDSPCSDKKESARKAGLYWSYKACSGTLYDEPQPQLKKGNPKLIGFRAQNWKRRHTIRGRKAAQKAKKAYNKEAEARRKKKKWKARTKGRKWKEETTKKQGKLRF